jgi:hypothetical protein
MLAIVAVLHLVLLGCSTETITPTESEKQRVATGPGPAGPPAAAATDEPLVTFEVQGEQVSITGYERDTINHITSLFLRRILASGEIAEYNLVLHGAVDSDELAECGMALQSPAGQLLFGVDFGWDASKDDSDWLRMTERTEQDELTLVRQIAGAQVTETFNFNGETRVFSFEETVVPLMSRNSPNPEMESPEQVQIARSKKEAIAEFDAWKEYFSPKNSLNSNENGEFLIRTVSADGFANWVGDEFYEGGSMTSVPDACKWFIGCAALKCRAPNVVCVICATGALVCLIIMLIEWMSDFMD